MGIVEKLNKIGIKLGHSGDILLDSAKQVRLIQDFDIDTKTDRFSRYRCIIAPNPGKRKFRTPLFGYNRDSNLHSSSLQLGIFNLLYFEQVLPIDPTERGRPRGSFELKLYKIPEDRFNLKDLVSRYNLQKVYYNFLELDDKYKKTQAQFIDAYESMTYQKFLKTEKVRKKAFLNSTGKQDHGNEPQMEVIENTDRASIDEFETLMAAQSQQSEFKI